MRMTSPSAMLVAMIWRPLTNVPLALRLSSRRVCVAVAHEDRVAAGHALLLDADVGGQTAADVGDLRVERDEPLGAVVGERQVVAEGRQPAG